MKQKLSAKSRFSIGIDLGTTNTAMAYIPMDTKSEKTQVFSIPQLHELGVIANSETLPSNYYFPTQSELESTSVNIFGEGSHMQAPPVVGALAHQRLTTLPGRVVVSAKSWLSNHRIDQEQGLLPFGSDEITPDSKLSPVVVSAAYLEHLRLAWNSVWGKVDPTLIFENQKIIITVPASFDEGAQALTRKATEIAGFPAPIYLLEEPQAAFYAWLENLEFGEGSLRHQFLNYLPALRDQTQNVLVCDVGGGTTDFSLFRLQPLGLKKQIPQIERVAVSDHLLLGGDNIDLTLAHVIEQQLLSETNIQLTRRQWNQLIPQARHLKERILSEPGELHEQFPVSLVGDGSNLLRAALTTNITRQQLEAIILEAFFPEVAQDAKPMSNKQGLREFGLPYAQDTAITKYLANFVSGFQIDAVLCAGGSLQPQFLQERLIKMIACWQQTQPVLLPFNQTDMNLAIARGAAYYGYLPHSSQRRIKAGQARSVYIELHNENAESFPELVCVLPQGSEAGSKLKLKSPSFTATINCPVRFSAYTSTHRKADQLGTLVVYNSDEFIPLPSLQATLTLEHEGNFSPKRREVDVQLESVLNELGVIQLLLYNLEYKRHWSLEFNLRKGGQFPSPQQTTLTSVDKEDDLAEPIFAHAEERIALFYGQKKLLTEHDQVKNLIKDLEKIFNMERSAWGLSTLRRLWPHLYEGMNRRGRSIAHENTWLYLAGYSLRPGYGAELDPWRMTELWACFGQGVYFKKEKSVQANWWMMWRRVAGGLTLTQQESLYQAALVGTKHDFLSFPEVTCLIATLERLTVAKRIALANQLFDMMLKRKSATSAHIYWALTRLLSRIPQYTSDESVLPPQHIEGFLDKVIELDWKNFDLLAFNALWSAACRNTGDRTLNIHESYLQAVVDKLTKSGAKDMQIALVREYHPVTSEQRSDLFGESLPAGLRLSTKEV